MTRGLIGFGQAGGEIVDAFLGYDRDTPGEFVRAAVAVNTATTDPRGLDRVSPRSGCSSARRG